MGKAKRRRPRSGPAALLRFHHFPIEANYYFANNTTAYRIASDDGRFLMARYVGESARVELVLVQNFFEELREDVGR